MATTSSARTAAPVPFPAPPFDGTNALDTSPVGLGFRSVSMHSIWSPPTPGRSNAWTISPDARLKTPRLPAPTGTMRCSVPSEGVTPASTNGYGAGSFHPF